MFNAYLLAYILWPRACHAFVGYLEEEAVKTYTNAIQVGRTVQRTSAAMAMRLLAHNSWCVVQVNFGLPTCLKRRHLPPAPLQSVDAGGGLAAWASRPAPPIARMYWRLPEGSTLRDVLLSVRADEVRASGCTCRIFTFACGRVLQRVSAVPSCGLPEQQCSPARGCALPACFSLPPRSHSGRAGLPQPRQLCVQRDGEGGEEPIRAWQRACALSERDESAVATWAAVCGIGAPMRVHKQGGQDSSCSVQLGEPAHPICSYTCRSIQ